MKRIAGGALGVAVAASVVAAAPLHAAEADGASPGGEPLLVETPFWSAEVADSLLAAAPDLAANPFAVLVRFVDGAGQADVDRVLASIDGRLVGAHDLGGGSADTVHVVETRTGIEDALESLRASELVAHAEMDGVVAADALSNDTYIGRQWSLDGTFGLDVAPAWTATASSAPVVVAVIDTGVDGTHPDLAARMWTNAAEIAGNGIDDDGNGYVDDLYGWDFVDDDNDPTDPNGHGTHIAGVIAAEVDNAAGIAGVAPNARILPLRFLNNAGSGFTSDAIAALEYAAKQGVEITNNSWGGAAFSSSLSTAIAEATGQLFVAASGNSSLDLDATPVYPAAYSAANVLSVAAHSSTGEASSFSNIGRSTVDVSAPGSTILSTVPDGGYASASGTSMATPHATGLAALVKGVDPALTPVEVIDLLVDTARWDGGAVADTTGSGGYLDAGRAARAADPAAPTIEIQQPAASAAAGSEIGFSAIATGGTGDLDIVWYADAATGNLDDTVIGTGPSVVFSAAEPGRIRVRAEVTDGANRWHIDARVFDVVDGVPSAPRRVALTPGDSSATVSWSTPASDGGSPINGYIATAQPSGASCRTSTTSCVIDGLTNGTTYSVTVIAHNQAGDGVGAVAGAVTPAAVPTAPRSLVAIAGDHRLDVFWDHPSSDGGAAVVSYAVRLEPSGATCETSGRSCAITGLENGVSQTVSVVAINAMGTGSSTNGITATPVASTATCTDVSVPTSFVDVSASSYALSDVECLRVLGVTTGTSATTYSPDAVVTREQMAAFLSRLYREITGETCEAGASSFVDVSSSSYAAGDIACLVSLGVTTGTSATTYAPNAVVTREQMAAFLSRLYRQVSGDACDVGPTSFPDVSATSYAVNDVECLRVLGVTTGTSATTYSPDAEVTREQMAAFLARLFRAIASD